MVDRHFFLQHLHCEYYTILSLLRTVKILDVIKDILTGLTPIL